MEGQIISPWLIYWLGMIFTAKTFVGTICMFSGGILIISMIVIFVGKIVNDDIGKNLVKVFKVILKYSLIIFLIFGILDIIVPDKEIVIGMAIANFVTYEKLELFNGFGIETKDILKQDIIDIINEIQNEKEGSK